MSSLDRGTSFSRSDRPRILVGSFLLAFVVLAALGADWLARADPLAQDRLHALQAPSSQAPSREDGNEPFGMHTSTPSHAPVHWLGTDALGRDVWSRTLHAARFSLLSAFAGALAAVLVGGFVGAVSGWFGGSVDRGAMRFTEVVMALPALYLVLAIRNLFPYGIGPLAAGVIVACSLGVVGWMVVARMVRAQVLALREQLFVSAAIASGGSSLWLLRRHVVPALVPFLALQLGLSLPYFLMGEVSLSFLGLGQVPPHPSWGGMLSQASEDLGRAWWVWLAPAVFLTSTVVGLNLLMDRFRQPLAPELSGNSATASDSATLSTGSKQRRHLAS